MTYEYEHLAGNEYLVTLDGEVPETFNVIVYESEDEINALVDAFLAAKSAAPAAPGEPAPQYPRLLVRDFLALFTREEKLAVKAATRVSDELGLWYDEMLAAQFITAEDPDTAAGMDALVAHNLLTSARRDEILGTMQPTSAETPVAPV